MVYDHGKGLPISRLILLCLVLCVCFNAQETAGRGDVFLPCTRRQRRLHVGRLEPSMDDPDRGVVLVSVTEELSLFLPLKQGSVDSAALENLVFDGSFDSLWFYVLLNRGFEDLEWAACSGQWRPEWSAPLPYDDTDRFFAQKETLTTTEEGSDSPDVPYEHTFEYMRYILSHHGFCSSSSFSFCAHSSVESPSDQFQWAAKFMSALLSSSLGWTDKTPRHIRPCGTIYQRSSNSTRFLTNTRGFENQSSSWCSYHQVYNDLVCSQHVNSLLNGGRRIDKGQNGLPEGIFSAVLPSLKEFFSAPFSHVHFRAKQVLRADNAEGSGELELRVQTRMSLVFTNASLIDRMAKHWANTLKTYAEGGDLRIYVGRGGIPDPLRMALPIKRDQLRCVLPFYQRAMKSAVALSEAHDTSPKEEEGTLEMVKHLRQPEVKYSLRPIGKDHGYLVVTLQPSLLLSACEISGQFSKVLFDKLDPVHMPFKEGDVVYSLVFFPLHLVRPRLYDMESLSGSTEVENYMTDVSTNTLTVLLKTKITALHVDVYRFLLERAVQRTQDCQNWEDGELSELRGLLLARFQFYNGWTGLKEMPRNANSYRVIPEPIVFIEREVKRAEAKDGATPCSVVCQRENLFSEVTHIDTLLGLLQVLRRPSPNSDYTNAPSLDNGSVIPPPRADSTCRCQYGVRAAPASGAFVPEPDASMMFNFVVLGLLFSSVAAVLLTKVTSRLMYPDLFLKYHVHELEKGEIDGHSNKSDVLVKKNQ